MMHYIVHQSNPFRVVKRYNTLRGAKIGLAAYLRQDKGYTVVSKLDFDKNDVIVTVKNLLSGKPVQLRQSEVGTCVDPSTERYWSM